MITDRAREAARLFRKVSYFQELEPEILLKVAQSASVHELEAGQIIILEGEPASGLYIVELGWLKVSKIAVDGREQILQLLGSGQAFNAVSVFTEAPNAASVTALEAARVWHIRRDTMLRLLDTHPPLARYVIQDLAGRVLHLVSLVEDLSLRSVEARLARLLLEQAVENRVERKRWATQTEIASRLGTVPDVVSRTLRRLAEQGLIQISRQEIQILDPEELEAIARIAPDI